ncbi:MAG: hypothetical protein LBD52_00625 [Prevotellaceae bacterium]|nr:hypothetical protein [Prevotellaceae bacterium]
MERRDFIALSIGKWSESVARQTERSADVVISGDCHIRYQGGQTVWM